MVNTNRTSRHRGFVASYILYGISLLALVGAAYGRLSVGELQSRAVQAAIDEVSLQLEVLTGKIMLCGAIYQDGDHNQFEARYAYPAPATVGNTAAVSVVECPGAPAGSKSLAAMPDGMPMPVSPPDFSEWIYEHTEANGVRLRLVPRVPGGASTVRVRLLRTYAATAVADNDEVVFTVLK